MKGNRRFVVAAALIALGLRAAPTLALPDMVPATPPGWDAPVVPRPDTTGQWNNVVIDPGPLPGYGNTYYNSARTNIGATPAFNNPNSVVTLDDDVQYTSGGGDQVDPGEYLLSLVDEFVYVIPGGRHTVRIECDWFDAEVEEDETNNVWADQYVWSGVILSPNLSFTADGEVPATSADWGPWYNCEGFEGSIASASFRAFAVMPGNGSQDVDVRTSSVAPMNVPRQGFGSYQAWSSSPAGEIDFVVLDGYEAPLGPHYASVVSFAEPNTAKHVMFVHEGLGVAPDGVLAGPFTIGSSVGLVLHRAVGLSATTTYRVDLYVVTGDADLSLALFPTVGTGIYAKHEYFGFADDNGAGEDEGFLFTTTDGGHYPIAVYKNDQGDFADEVTFYLRVSTTPNLVSNEPLGWDDAIVPRNAQDVGVPDVVILPDSLIGNTSPSYFNFTVENEGAAATVSAYDADLFVDDVPLLTVAGTPLGSGLANYWLDRDVGAPDHFIRGGRHHVRVDADVDGDVAEFDETDNTYVKGFVWTPMWLADQTPVTRSAPPVKNPVGYVHYSCDGFRALGAPAAKWTAVGIIPEFGLDDFNIRMHDESTGPEDGFGAAYALSDDGRGFSDFSLVNYTVAAKVDHDYGVIREGGDSEFRIQRADGIDLPDPLPPVSTYGPFGIADQDVLELFTVRIPPAYLGLDIDIELLHDGGDANLGIAAYSGLVGYHGKPDMAAGSHDGVVGDEGFVYSSLSEETLGIAVYKDGSSDLGKTATFRLRISVDPLVAVVEGVPAPHGFALLGPAPNPFNPLTEIRYQVPGEIGRLILEVVNLRGERVKTLVSGSAIAGDHRVAWDGRDDAGRDAGSGVYFVRMVAGEFTESRKMVLLR